VFVWLICLVRVCGVRLIMNLLVVWMLCSEFLVCIDVKFMMGGLVEVMVKNECGVRFIVLLVLIVLI